MGLVLRHYQFGTPLGKDRLLIINEALASGKTADVTESNDVQMLYAKAFGEFGNRFDKRILSDLKALG